MYNNTLHVQCWRVLNSLREIISTFLSGFALDKLNVSHLNAVALPQFLILYSLAQQMSRKC